ncbi:hypothetical protein ACFVDQ_25845 [Streptomyces sp. NPDC057684]|uniref:hypothetical protein n=1 Tax=unclassified Streptomyces TaxID=2593676 RepID=UPI0036A1082E
MAEDDSYLAPEVLEHIRITVMDWSHAYRESSPADIRVVSTNRDDATELLSPGVRSELDPCYLVLLEGYFRVSWTLKLPEATRVWAALKIDPRSMSVGSFTVRPLEDFPSRPLSDLGTVYVLA